MKNYTMFLGCNIPARVSQYADAAMAVLRKLGVEPVNIRSFYFPMIAPYYSQHVSADNLDTGDFNCCGYPMRNTDELAFLVSATKNLAVAERAGTDILVLCKCCYGSLKKAEYMLQEDNALKKDINGRLKGAGLKYEGNVQIRHLLSVLYHEIGVSALKKKVSSKFKKLNIATHYGCHALRPSNITQFDNPVAPTLFDELVTVTGASSVDWNTRLECCGAPQMGINDKLSMDLTRKKLADAAQSGADYLCTACPYCHIQFDTVQQQMAASDPDMQPVASILYPQLLGLCLGISEKALGIHLNHLDITGVKSFLS